MSRGSSTVEVILPSPLTIDGSLNWAMAKLEVTNTDKNKDTLIFILSPRKVLKQRDNTPASSEKKVKIE
jgi:hypothetical protein